jgi:hypothetical protein
MNMFIYSIYTLMIENCKIFGLKINEYISSGETLEPFDMVFINDFLFMFASIYYTKFIVMFPSEIRRVHTLSMKVLFRFSIQKKQKITMVKLHLLLCVSFYILFLNGIQLQN